MSTRRRSARPPSAGGGRAGRARPAGRRLAVAARLLAGGRAARQHHRRDRARTPAGSAPCSTLAARNMTTLDVRVGQLRTAVAPLSGGQGPAGQHPVPARDADPRASKICRSGRWSPAGGRSRPAATGRCSTTSPPARCRRSPCSSLPGGSQVTDRGRAGGPGAAGGHAAPAGGADRAGHRRLRRTASSSSFARAQTSTSATAPTWRRSGRRPPRCWPIRARPGRPTST